jgi:dTDP-glucose pyrophosphorylase/predicted transcriptional regulator
MNTSISRVCVRSEAPLHQVLEVLQNSPFGICLVVDSNLKLVGTVTDGDCRRALLRGNSLAITAQEIMHREFVVVDQTFSLDQIKVLMRTNGVDQIPIVDANNTVVDLITSNTFYRPKERDTVALVLAGGKGKRLRPLTTALPKPMLPIGGKPMLEQLIEQLVSHGIHKIFISVNYLGHIIQEHFGDGEQFGCRIQYITETKELGTAGPVRLVREFATYPILVVNGDLVTSVDFGACLDFHRARRHDLTVGVSSYTYEIPFGVVSTDENGNILQIIEKPSQNVSINAGFYAVEPGLLDLIPPDTYYPMTDFIDTAIKAHKSVGAFAVHEAWADVGLPEQYQLLK